MDVRGFLRTRELFAWGSLEGGRLGVGFKKKRLQQTPLAVIPHWAETGGALMAPAEQDTNYEAATELFQEQMNDQRIFLQPVGLQGRCVPLYARQDPRFSATASRWGEGLSRDLCGSRFFRPCPSRWCRGFFLN